MDTGNPHQAGGGSSRTSRLEHGISLALLVVVGLVFYRSFFSDDLGPLHRDFGTIFLSKMQQQYDALRAGTWLLWDPILYGGTAFWPLPNTAPAYLPLLGGFLVRGSALGGLNLVLLLHLLWGALGTYWLLFRLTDRRFAALAGGLLFLYARYTQQLAFILPLDLMALSWMPWALYFLILCLHGGPVVRCGLAAGLAYSAVSWCGGYNIFLYGLLICGVVVTLGSFRAPWRSNLFKGLMLIVVFFVTFLVLSAGRLIPTACWLPMTSRADPLPLEFASIGRFTGAEIADWLRQEGWIVMALLAVGLIVALKQRRLTWSVPFTMAVGMIVLFSSGLVFPFLHEYVPGFNRIREPRRVCIMMPCVMPVVAGLGLAHCQEWVSWKGVKALVLGIAFMGVLFADTALDFRFQASGSDGAGFKLSYQRPNLYSLRRRLNANAVHLELAKRARSEPRFRVHDYGDTRDNLKRTADLIRSGFRLETLEAVLGNISIRDYDFDYFSVSEASPALLWGLMNCRYVTSGKPLDVPGLEFVAKFEEDPYELKPDSDGPYLYENTQAMPRAWIVEHAALFVDREPHDGYTWRSMVYGRAWDHRTTALVLGKPGILETLPAPEFEAFDLIFAYSDSGLDPKLLARLEETGVPVFDFQADPIDPAVLSRFRETLKSARTPYVTVPDPQKEWNRMRLALPETDGLAWLVLAETFALYPGWTAATPDGRKLPLFVADGVATAIPLTANVREVELEYEPPGWRIGMIISLAGFLICALLIFKGGIRDLCRAWPEPGSSE
ncbi:MAG: hypothetical protein ABIK28_01320 [Planctomycetota bacterium]